MPVSGAPSSIAALVDPPTTTPTTTTTAGAPLVDLEGRVVVSGSSQVEPLSAAVAADLLTVAPSVEVTVDGPGTGDGFARLCDGELDIAMASRPMAGREQERCARAGVETVQLHVAWGGLAVVTAAPSPVSCLSVADLYALIGPESRGFDDWSDGAGIAQSLGSTTQLPTVPLTVVTPGEAPPVGFLLEELIDDVAAWRGVPEPERTIRPDITASPQPGWTVGTVAATPGALGVIGLPDLPVDQADVESVPIADLPGAPCAPPTVEAVQAGTYPLADQHVLHVRVPGPDDDALRAYVDHYLERVTDLAPSVGMIAASAADLAAATTRWRDPSPAQPEAELSGRVVVDPTGAPIEDLSAIVAAELERRAPHVEVSIEGPALNLSIELLCQGSADIATSTRPLDDRERAACVEHGIVPIELLVGSGGFAVVTASPAPVACLTFADLYALLGPEATGTTNWRDATTLAAALGSTTALPDLPLAVFTEFTGWDPFLGTTLFEPMATARGLPGDLHDARVDVITAPSGVLDLVGTTPGSLGLVDLFTIGTGAATAVPIPITADPAGRCTAPSPTSLAAAAYDLGRSYRLLVRTPGPDDDALVAYVDLYLELLADAAPQAGVLPRTDAQIAAQRTRWESR
jgi:phosphate transport system substrate-binding protein